MVVALNRGHQHGPENIICSSQPSNFEKLNISTIYIYIHTSVHTQVCWRLLGGKGGERFPHAGFRSCDWRLPKGSNWFRAQGLGGSGLGLRA